MEPYNPDWPAQFSRIQASLQAQLASIQDITIEHIGLTSIPDLPARPTIDILITAPLTAIDTIPALLSKTSSYTLRPSPSYPHTTLLLAPDATPPHTLTLCPPSSLPARATLALRTTLRTPDLRADLLTNFPPVSTAPADPANPANPEDQPNPQDAQDPALHAYAPLPPHTLHTLLIASAAFSTPDLAALISPSPSPSSSSSPLTAHWPPLHTPRLLLREFALRDVDGVFSLESSVENARYQEWAPWTRGRARRYVVSGIAGAFGHEGEREVVELAVVLQDKGGGGGGGEEDDEGPFIGRVGARIEALTGAETGSRADVKTKLHLWYSFLPSAQGQGLATEATRAFIEALLKRRRKRGTGEGTVLEIECDPRNTPSWRLAARLGFERVSLTERAWECKGEWVGSLVYQKAV